MGQITALAAVTSTDRGRVVDYWEHGGPGVKAAAEAALTGSDADVQAFLAAVDDLTFQDDRVSTAQLASVGGTELIAAARTGAIRSSGRNWTIFLDDGWMAPLEQDQRVRVAQIIDAGGPNVQDAGRAALNGTADDVTDVPHGGAVPPA